MRVLWVTYEPVGQTGRILNGMASQSATWVDATAARLQGADGRTELAVAAIHRHSRKVIDHETRVTYYGVAVRKLRGRRDAESARAAWAAVLDDFKPDIIQIWGTEYTNGLDVIDAAQGIPVVLCIQGVMRAIAKYRYGCLPLSELGRSVGLLDRLKCIKLMLNQRDIDRQVAFEEDMVAGAKNILVDSEWCLSYYRSFCPTLKAHHLTLAVSPMFLHDRWRLDQTHGHDIFCIAGRTPYKGLHQAIKAMAIVRREIPDARLIIPGDMSTQGSALLTRSPYLAYLDRLISDNRLQDGIEFCGRLDSEQMASRMLTAGAFVMPSCIENYSTTLREAMYLGMPCISAFAGAVHEAVEHGRNGLLYRYEEYEDLAHHIIRVLTDPALAIRLGSQAFDSIRLRYPQDQPGAELDQVYRSILQHAGMDGEAATEGSRESVAVSAAAPER